ncbi:MAG TPA: hypothetical protein VF554_01705 [Thermoanaerobaculia bacterium]
MPVLLRRFPELSVAGLAFGLNAAWEFLQSPLYSDHGREFGYLLRTRLHCAAGDTLILFFAFGVTSLALRSRQWLHESRCGPTILFVSIGFAYTVWSEWFNTQVTLSWHYAESMPRVFGIGLAPLAQWLVVPVLLVLIFRGRQRQCDERRLRRDGEHDERRVRHGDDELARGRSSPRLTDENRT